MNRNLTKEFVSSLQDLMSVEPTEVDRKQVRRCLLDYFGATLAGVKLLKEKSESIIDMAGQYEDGLTIIGLAPKVALETACLVNGLNSHVAEMDDGVRFGMIHPGAPIFSALLPVAEKFDVTEDSFIIGALVGYDAALRLASAIQPSHYKRGYHPTATCGSIGAAMGVAAMLGYDSKEMEDTLGAISVCASGSLKVVDKGSELKPLNVGRAASLGVQSALLGKSGLSAPPDVLSGETGFLNMTADSVNAKCLVEPAPNRFWIHSVYVKPYSACRHAHPAIEAALELSRNKSIQLDQIKSINITTYHGLKGRHDHQEVSNVSSARMSIPFSVAIALKYSGAGVNEFTLNAVENAEIQRLSKKINIIEDENYTARVPQQRSAKFELYLNDETYFELEILYPKGEPENLVNDQELIAKFFELAKFGGVPEDQSNALLGAVWNIPKNFKEMFRVLENCRTEG